MVCVVRGARLDFNVSVIRKKPLKKQQLRVKKSLFSYEMPFFSSSMRLPVKKQFFAGD
jgi:hypothetical protein